MRQPLTRLVAAALVAVSALSGCATNYLLDNSVQSFSSLPTLPANPTYRFERLPSQQAFPFQTHVEAMADPALFNAGLRRDDAAPRFSLQVSARVQRVRSPWADPYPWGGWGWGPSRFGYVHPFYRMDDLWFHREVAIVMRELPSNRVVYESHARNDGPWGDDASVFPAMFAAALQGFPNPPAGVRRVDVQVGR